MVLIYEIGENTLENGPYDTVTLKADAVGTPGAIINPATADAEFPIV